MKINQYNLPKVIKMRDQFLLYARKSTESDDRQVASIENQLAVLYELASKKGINILSTFTEARSAKKPGRIAFNQMIDVINSREDIKGIICWKLNRLSRNPQDSGLLQQLLYDGRLIEIVTPTKKYTEVDSDFVMSIESSQAQRFIRDLREDTKRGIDAKLLKGHAPINAPAGYKNDMEKRQGERTISPHPVYFELVKKLFQLAMTGQFSTMELYKKSRQMGIKTSSGRPLSRSQIYSLLRNPFYTGRFIYGGVVYVGSHKYMISDEEFESVQQILQTRSHPRKSKHSFELNGFIKCGRCNHMFTGETHTKKSGLQLSYYKCSMKGRGCVEPMIPAKDLNNQVQVFLNSISLKPVYVDFCTKWLRNAEAQDRLVRNKQHEALKSDYTASVKKLDNLTDKWLSLDNEDKSLISDSEYKVLKQRYLIDKQTIYRKMKTMDQDISQWTDTLVSVFNFTKGLTDRWKFGTVEQKKHIMLVVGANLVIKNKNLTINPRSPFKSIQNFRSNPKFKATPISTVSNNLVLGGLANVVRTNFKPGNKDYEIIRSVLILNSEYQNKYAY